MTFTVEVDAEGKIELPQQLLRTMHLEPGSRLDLIPDEFSEGTLSLSSASTGDPYAKLVWVNGFPAVEAVAGAPAEDTLKSISQMRKERDAAVSGFSLDELK